MSQSTLCRLCRTSSLEFKSLFDDSGQLNRVYKIAVKYFDPMLLYPGNDRTSKVICMECWQHINGFYAYQQSVLNSQAQLEYVQSFVSVVKLEEQFPKTSWSQQSTSFSIYDFIEPDRIATTQSSPAPSTSVSVFELVNLSGIGCPSKQNINSPVANENDKIISKWRRDLECILCKLKFPTYSLLSKHFGQKHYGIKCRITCCGRNFFESCSIVDHIHQIHKDEIDKSYHCKLCTIQFSQDEQLTAHVLQMHSENYLEKCTNKERSKNDEDENIQEEQEQLVDIIDEIFQSFIASTDDEDEPPETTVNNAVLNKNQINEQIPLQTDDEDEPPESTVNNAVLNKNQINEQIPLQSNAKLSDVNEKKQEDCKNNKFPVNRKSFKEVRIETDTIITKNLGELKCYVCGKAFKSLNLLRMHFKSKHKKKRMYITCCGRRLSMKRCILQHIRENHNGENFIYDKEKSKHKEGSTQSIPNTNRIDDVPDLSKNQSDGQTSKNDETTITKQNYYLEIDVYNRFIKKHKKNLECPKCSLTVTNFHILNNHFKNKHATEEPYILCCNLKLSSRKQIYDHLLLSHINTKMYHCTKCERKFNTSLALKNHQRLIHENKLQSCNSKENRIKSDEIIAKAIGNLECIVCQKPFPTVHLLGIHFKLKHKDTQFHIYCCGRKLRWRWHILKHVSEKHKGKRKSPRKEAESTDSFLNEKRNSVEEEEQSDVNTNNTEVIPDTQGPTAFVKKLLSQDAFIKKYKGDLECPLCSNLLFENYLLLSTHFKIEHPTAKPYAICCNIRLISRSHIYEHVQLHANPDTYQCSICTKNFTNTSNLKGHWRNVHNKTDEIQLKGVWDNTQDDLIKKHKGKLECPICKLLFENFTLLARHFRTEHPTERPYMVCCNLRHFSRSLIYEHLLLHVNPNAYQCLICERVFKNRSSLKLHKRTIHDKNKPHIAEIQSKEAKPNREIQSDETKQNPEVHNEKTKQNRKNQSEKFKRNQEMHREEPKQNSEMHSEEPKQNSEKHNEENNIYKCPSCSQEFSKFDDLEEHTSTLHKKNKEYKCDKCPAMYRREDFLKAHCSKNYEYNYTQSFNDSNTGALQQLSKENGKLIDINHEHSQSSDASSSNLNTTTAGKNKKNEKVSLNSDEQHSDQREDISDKEETSVCMKKFNSNWSLKIHRRITHKIKNKSKLDGVRDDPNDALIKKHKEKLECPLCNVLLKNVTLLGQHFRTEHPTERPHIVCCNLRHLGWFHMYSHLLLHANPNSYRCSICERVFKTIWHLKSHKQNFHGKCPSKLSKPPSTVRGRKRFRIESDNVIAKTLRHLECFVCKKAFPTLHLLNLHFKVKHKDTKFHLKCCGRQLIDRAKILQHARKMHSEGTKRNLEIQSEETKQNRETQSKETKQNREIQGEESEQNREIQSEETNKNREIQGEESEANREIQSEEYNTYKCPSCSEEFSKCDELKKHTCRLHKKNKKYKCDKCPAIYRREDFFKAHYRKNHEYISKFNNRQNSNQSFNLEIQSEETKQNREIQSEETNQNREIQGEGSEANREIPSEEYNTYKCPSCSEEFSKYDELEKHTCRLHKKNKKYNCDKCPAIYRREDFFKAHYRKNHEYISSSSEKFNNRQSFNDSSTGSLQQLSKENVQLIDINHGHSQNSDASSSNLSSNFTNQQSEDSSSDELEKICGKRKKKEYKCEKCPAVYMRKDFFMAHCRKNHEHISSSPEKCTKSHSYNKSFKCDKCPAVYKSNFTNHNNQQSEDRKRKKKEYKCEKCPAVYMREDFFMAHCRKNHEHISSSPEKCTKSHTYNKSFKCDKCPAVYKSNFTNHNNQQSEDRKRKKKEYKCEKCPAVYMREDFFMIHCQKNHEHISTSPEKCTKSHSSNKSFKCDKCPAVYKREDFFKAHCRKNHEHPLSESIYFSSSLEKCKKAYYSNQSFNNSGTEALQQLSKENAQLIDLNHELSQSSYASSSNLSSDFNSNNNRQQSEEKELSICDEISQWSIDPTTNILKSPKKEKESINDSIPETIACNQIQISSLDIIDVKEEVEDEM